LDSSNQNDDGFIYYPFRNGLQMVEIDNYSGFQAHQMKYYDKSYVPPYPGKSLNEYFFRDTSGKIVKHFNGNYNIDSVAKTLKPITFVNKKSHGITLFDNTYETVDFNGFYNVFEGSSQGVIDSLGNIFIPIEYTYIIHKPNCFVVQKNKKYSLITIKNHKLNTDFYDNYHERAPLIYFSNGNKFCVVYNYETGFLDTLSKYEDVRMLGQGYEGLAWIKKNNKWGLWNYLNNTQLLSFDYDSGEYFSYFFGENYRKAVIVSQNGKYGLISLMENKPMIILKCEYDKIYPSRTQINPPSSFKEGYITVEKNGKISEFEINILPLTRVLR